LVSASIFFVRKKIEKWTIKTGIIFIIGIVFAYILSGLIPAQTPATPLFFFLSGAVAISAMILPGVSGSFLLVVMGKYEQILHAVNDKYFYTLGIIIGIAFFIQILSWLLKHHYDITFSFLLGLMVGSLRKVWPWKEAGANVWPHYSGLENLIIIALMIAGFFIVFLLLKLSNKKES
jgi:putative membrane protein